MHEKYYQNKDSSYLPYLNKSNFYWSTISQKLTADGFEWTKNTYFTEKC